MDGNQSKYHFLTLHPPWRAPSLQGDGFPSLFETVDSASPGKPFVQNDRGGIIRIDKGVIASREEEFIEPRFVLIAISGIILEIILTTNYIYDSIR